jgi:hypothetical protein
VCRWFGQKRCSEWFLWGFSGIREMEMKAIDGFEKKFDPSSTLQAKG